MLADPTGDDQADIVLSGTIYHNGFTECSTNDIGNLLVVAYGVSDTDLAVSRSTATPIEPA